jgi:hypothetical protein
LVLSFVMTTALPAHADAKKKLTTRTTIEYAPG